MEYIHRHSVTHDLLDMLGCARGEASDVPLAHLLDVRVGAVPVVDGRLARAVGGLEVPVVARLHVHIRVPDGLPDLGCDLVVGADEDPLPLEARGEIGRVRHDGRHYLEETI